MLFSCVITSLVILSCFDTEKGEKINSSLNSNSITKKYKISGKDFIGEWYSIENEIYLKLFPKTKQSAFSGILKFETNGRVFDWKVDWKISDNTVSIFLNKNTPLENFWYFYPERKRVSNGQLINLYEIFPDKIKDNTLNFDEILLMSLNFKQENLKVNWELNEIKDSKFFKYDNLSFYRKNPFESNNILQKRNSNLTLNLDFLNERPKKDLRQKLRRVILSPKIKKGRWKAKNVFEYCGKRKYEHIMFEDGFIEFNGKYWDLKGSLIKAIGTNTSNRAYFYPKKLVRYGKIDRDTFFYIYEGRITHYFYEDSKVTSQIKSKSQTIDASLKIFIDKNGNHSNGVSFKLKDNCNYNIGLYD